MTGSRMRPAIFVGLFLGLLAIALQGVQGEEEELEPVPSEDLCRPYIEKALKDLGTGSLEQTSAEVEAGASEDGPGEEVSNEQGDESTSKEGGEDKREESQEDDQDSINDRETVEVTSEEAQGPNDESAEKKENDSAEEAEGKEADDDNNEIASNEAEQKDEPEGDDKAEEKDEGSVETNVEDSKEGTEESKEGGEVSTEGGEDSKEGAEESKEGAEESKEGAEESKEGAEDSKEGAEGSKEGVEDSKEGSDAKVDSGEKDKEESGEKKDDDAASKADDQDDSKDDDSKTALDSKETDSKEDAPEDKSAASAEEKTNDSEEKDKDGKSEEEEGDEKSEVGGESKEEGSKEAAAESNEGVESADSVEEAKDSKEAEESSKEEVKGRSRREADEEGNSEREKSDEAKDDDDDESLETESMPEEELIQEIEVPENLRPREHINQLLKLDEDNEEKEKAIGKAAEIILRDLKRLYDTAIKPLETLYKYRDLSNRHFGDPEIFSKPLVLFMGPWSGGKSSIINYLLDNEYKSTSLRTGAEPSPAYFNILMHGEEEVLDGTQLAADWTFSGLQKFGQGMLDRLRGLRLNNKLLEKVNIVEIPGILEIRKQVQRLFPFNDACQWFIDRADIIFLVYDPSKLDVGPETEAILDQLKGREYQTRIILNKADQVKPEELMRVQGALIWNISPLMSSAEPPIMYSTSLWSMPYEAGAPTRLLYAQERAFLRDLRSAVDKRVEHKIASARRFAVRVRNHAKMVDCYLTTYYNHKSFFGNKKDTSDKIIENPQDYHIYEGLSTLTNISRYDLPDPDVYRDFFRLNPLYEFPLLSSTCTYFRGCPINRLDVAIAYDLPELVGKYKKSVEAALHESEPSSPTS